MNSISNIPQGSSRPIPFKMVLSSDHFSPAPGKTVVVTISKNGGAFANPSAGPTTATEIGNGWYAFTPSATDTGTLGPLVVLGTAASCDNGEAEGAVVSANNGDLLALPNAQPGFGNGLFVLNNSAESIVDACIQITGGVTGNIGGNVQGNLLGNVNGNVAGTVGGVVANGIASPQNFSNPAQAPAIVTPIQASVSNPRYATRDLPPIAQGSAPADVWTITDANNNPVNLAGKDVRMVIYTSSDPSPVDPPFNATLTPVCQYETNGSGITIGGAENNVVTVQAAAGNTGTAGLFFYWLWDITDNIPLANGRYPIVPALMIG